MMSLFGGSPRSKEKDGSNTSETNLLGKGEEDAFGDARDGREEEGGDDSEGGDVDEGGSEGMRDGEGIGEGRGGKEFDTPGGTNSKTKLRRTNKNRMRSR